VIWNVRTRPSRTKRSGDLPVTALPRSSTLPLDGTNPPDSRLKSVVFPAPFDPITEWIDPASTERETSLTALKP